MNLVQSSNLRAVGYNHFARTLTLEFHGGRLYAYSGVPWSKYHELMKAASHGSYFHAYIRNHYPFRRLR